MRCGREEAVPKLKVCGITDAAFAVEAARRGIDYLGLIFAEGSPRRVTTEQASQIIAAVQENAVPNAPKFVGVFVNHSVEEIEKIASSLRLTVIQLHGNYGAEEIVALKSKGYEVWKLLDEGLGLSDREKVKPDAVLLDGRNGAQRGGTGKRADWSLVEPLKSAGWRIVLAGGISAANVADAIATGADIIDANSTLETAPGVKKIDRLDALLAAYRLVYL